MKYIILIFIAISFMACEKVSEDDIKNIEYLLGTPIETKYTIENFEEPFDFADYYKIFDLKFSEQEFNLLMKRVKLEEFEANLNTGYKTNFQYYREYSNKTMTMFLSIDTIKKSIHYSLKM
ncbi:hypothetical protein [Aequorivita echinoideorum]|uniref:DUF4296 domain-containing protein n=1 Tax=Aequorivita echinoideorum TaxID=1549647 RepID=A0ABS5S3C3_9FLAO|nr:hypothetical protein [Aequorivita echinoideorum]MBT0607717.1 hypothetical protein [Aequorivita echinoideorum]